MAGNQGYDIDIDVRTSYVRDKSCPEQKEYVWSYQVTITNHHTDIVQLLSRYWRITDDYNEVREVHGPGVVGQQPIIKPAESFVYSSFSMLRTRDGSMQGYFEMQTLTRDIFRIDIPAVALQYPVRLMA